MLTARTPATLATTSFVRALIRETVRSGLMTQTRVTRRCDVRSQAVLRGREWRPLWLLPERAIVSSTPTDSASSRETLLGRAVPSSRKPFPIQSVPAPTAMSVGVEPVLKVRTEGALVRIDPGDGPVLGVEHPDASRSRGDAHGSLPERDGRQRLARPRIERASVAARDRRVATVDRLGAAVADQLKGAHHGDGKPGKPGEDEQARTTAGDGAPDPWWLTPTGPGEHGILLQDAALEPLQALARLQPDLLGERQSTLLVDLQRLGLAVGAIEREHELAAEPLAKRMAGHERLELADELAVAAEGEIGLDPLFERRELKLFEACDLGLCERFVGEVDKRGTAPEGECPPQLLRRLLVLSLATRATRLLQHVAHAVRVELVALDLEDVAAPAGPEHSGSVRRGVPVAVERPPQPRDVSLEGLDGCRRGRLAP